MSNIRSHDKATTPEHTDVAKRRTQLAKGYHFISYSRRDGSASASDLVDSLRAESPSIPVWWDRDIKSSRRDWDDQINDSIRNCETFLYLMTPDSVNENSHCKFEWSSALKSKKPILLLRLSDDVKPPPRLQDRHHIDFSDGLVAGIARIKLHFAWLDTAEGRIQGLRERLSEAQRDLVRQVEPRERKRIEKDIDELQTRIRDYEGEVVNPLSEVQQSLPRATFESIAAETRIDLRGGRIKVVNESPGIVPDYFQGRKESSDAILRFLSDPVKRLLVISGRGGIGKTSLACSVLQSLERGGDATGSTKPKTDGIIYVSLAADPIGANQLFSDFLRFIPEDRADKVQELLKVPETEKKVEALLRELGDTQAVVLLDNFEDMVDPDRNLRNREMADALAHIIRYRFHHGLKIIITSRVPPRELALVEPVRYQTLELSGLRSPYAERVLQAMDPDEMFGLYAAPQELLQTATTRTGGNPKALEKLFGVLAADRHTSLRELLEQSRQSLPEEVLEVLIGEAFSRLGRATQRVLQALAIYKRPVSARAVDYLLAPFTNQESSLKTLNRLVNMKFLQKQADQYSPDSTDWSYIIESVPQSRLNNVDSEEPSFTRIDLQLRAAAYCKQARKPTEDVTSIKDLVPQLAEFDLRCEADDLETAARVLLEVDSQHLRRMGHYQTIIDLHERLRGSLEDSTLEFDNLMHLSYAYDALHDRRRAAHFAEQARSLALEQEYRRRLADTLIMQGNQRASVGESKKAMALYQEALEIARQEDYPSGEARSFSNCGLLFLALGKKDRALECQNEALSIARTNHLEEEEALININRGEILLASNHLDKATEAFAQSAQKGKKLANRSIASYGYYYLALGQLVAERLNEAAKSAQRATEEAVPKTAYDTLVLTGIIALCQGNKAQAKRAFEGAVVTTEDILEQDSGHRLAQEALAMALCGLTLCGDSDHRLTAINAFRDAQYRDRSSGAVRRDLCLLAMRRADSRGLLDPVFRTMEFDLSAVRGL